MRRQYKDTKNSKNSILDYIVVAERKVNMLETVADELRKAAADFYEVTKIKIVLYDDERRVIYSYPSTMCDFCKAVRQNEKLAEKCLECDNAGFDICDKTAKPYVYLCHMYLAEAIAPIIESGVIIGYMMLGQVLTDGDVDKVKNNLVNLSKKYCFDTEELLKDVDKLNVVKLSTINSAVNIMTMCACYLYVNRIIRKKQDVVSYELKKFIDSHLFEELSVESICRKFYISKSKLYTVAKSSLGMGVSDYIRIKRLEEAERLLHNTTQSVSEIAEHVGFKDSNYFIRIFKKYVGCTPLKYRKDKFNQ